MPVVCAMARAAVTVPDRHYPDPSVCADLSATRRNNSMSLENIVRACAKALIQQCKNCDGAGMVYSAFLVEGDLLRSDCPTCADIRKALEED